MQIPRATLDTVALFFDFDGTLVHLAPTPESVHVPDLLRSLLYSLNSATGQALAIITGRSLPALDQLLGMKDINASGSHGAIYRFQGEQSSIDECYLIPEELVSKCRAFAKENQLIFEDKSFSVTFHYRQNPEKENTIEEWLQQAITAYPQLIIQRGKCVHEIKSKRINKGTAVEFFMDQPQFKGKTPWFFGDDTTDEHGFIKVNQMGGQSVKVGSGNSSANFRVSSPDDMLSFLHDWISRQD